MGDAFAAAGDVALRRAETFPDPVSAQITAWCGDLSAKIRARTPGIDAWITAHAVDPATGLDPAVVKAIVCEVVGRVLDGAGAAKESETYPEYAYRLSSAASVGLYLTEDEWGQLTPATPEAPSGRSRGAFSITPG